MRRAAHSPAPVGVSSRRENAVLKRGAEAPGADRCRAVFGAGGAYASSEGSRSRLERRTVRTLTMFSSTR